MCTQNSEKTQLSETREQLTFFPHILYKKTGCIHLEIEINVLQKSIKCWFKQMCVKNLL